MTWRHGVVLLLAAGAVQASTLMYDATTPLLRFLTRNTPDMSVYLVITVVLAVVVAGLAVTWKMNWYLLLLLAWRAAIRPGSAHRGLRRTGALRGRGSSCGLRTYTFPRSRRAKASRPRPPHRNIRKHQGAEYAPAKNHHQCRR